MLKNKLPLYFYDIKHILKNQELNYQEMTPDKLFHLQSKKELDTILTFDELNK